MPGREDDFDESDEHPDDDDGNDVLSDRDAPDPSDVDDSDSDDETIPCPYCGEPVYEGAELCPHCRSFISFEDAPRRHPWWIWIGVGLALAAMLWWTL